MWARLPSAEQQNSVSRCILPANKNYLPDAPLALLQMPGQYNGAAYTASLSQDMTSSYALKDDFLLFTILVSLETDNALTSALASSQHVAYRLRRTDAKPAAAALDLTMAHQHHGHAVTADKMTAIAFPAAGEAPCPAGQFLRSRNPASTVEPPTTSAPGRGGSGGHANKISTVGLAAAVVAGVLILVVVVGFLAAPSILRRGRRNKVMGAAYKEVVADDDIHLLDEDERNDGLAPL